MDKINKSELIDVVADESHVLKKDAARIIDTLFDYLETCLIAGQEINISGFGSFSVTTRAGKTIVHPSSGEKIDVPERKTVTFKPAKNLKEKVNR